MNDYVKSDKEFVDEVWNKVRYVQYQRMENEKVRKNEKAIFRKKVKCSIISLMITLILIVPLLAIEEFDIGVALLIGIIALGSSVSYEYFINTIINRGDILWKSE